MTPRGGSQIGFGVLALIAAMASGGWTQAATPGRISDIDLSKPFHASSEWHFHADQEPSETDPDSHDSVPGRIHLCLDRRGYGSCDAQLLANPPAPDALLQAAWRPRFLWEAQTVYPKGRSAPPLLMVRTASAHSGDGDQLVFTQMLAYRSDMDKFVRIYSRAVGHNNNQEVRFIDSGPMIGSIVAVEDTNNAPFAFWVEVYELTPAYTYKRVLRYRSATRYGDGNPLAVIDSEMPNIQRRLGLWKASSPPPLPARCRKPRLVKMELWCG
jgi:hypothetical protein